MGDFVEGAFKDPERGPLMHELRSYHAKFTKGRKKRDKEAHPESNVERLLQILPDKDLCDAAVTCYFERFEKSLRILHQPSFLEEYNRFWIYVGERQVEFISFIPQLVALVATYTQSNMATDLCAAVESWLNTQTGRKQLTIPTLRTQTLLVLARQICAASPDSIWSSTGKLVRSAMTAGLHRDPSEFPEVSIFDGEIRRRLWMTIVELDLGASLVYGMPFVLHAGQFTCRSPLNLNDIELTKDMTELPPLQPSKTFTDCAMQVALVGTLVPRLQAMVRKFPGQETIAPKIILQHVRRTLLLERRKLTAPT